MVEYKCVLLGAWLLLLYGIFGHAIAAILGLIVIVVMIYFIIRDKDAI